LHAILDDEKVNRGHEKRSTIFATGLLLVLLVAAITLALLGKCGRLCASVGRQGAAYIIAFFELAALASTDVPFVAFVRLDQFAWHHTLLWKTSGWKLGVAGSSGGMGDIEDAHGRTS
jgi:hypothetical protein